MTWTIYTNFRSPFPRRLHIKFGFDWPSGFRGEDVWKCERTEDDGRTPDPWVSMAFGSGELKNVDEMGSGADPDQTAHLGKYLLPKCSFIGRTPAVGLSDYW